MKDKKRTAAVIGRFQPFHNDHLRYVLAASEKYEHLLVGITNIYGEISSANPYDADRGKRESNPFTFYERSCMVREALTEAGIPRERFEIVPFPIESPDKIRCFIPDDAVCCITVYDQWGRRKAALLREQGFEVDVLWERGSDEKGISATTVRQLIADGKPWKHMVPEAVFRYIRERELEQRARPKGGR